MPTGDSYEWDDRSTYVRKPPYFDGMTPAPAPLADVHGARVLAKLGDSVTTDHISPAGNIRADGPAGRWLVDGGVEPGDFNSYGSRRGNHEVMIRGTFANIRLRNQLAPGTEGGVTRHLPDGEQMSIYDAAQRYAGRRGAAGHPGRQGVRLGFVAGLGGQGHRPARGAGRAGRELRAHPPFQPGGDGHPAAAVPGGGRRAASLGLTGEEVFDITGLEGLADGTPSRSHADRDAPGTVEFEVVLRIDTPKEEEYYRHGGILLYVLRMLHARD